MVFFGALTLQHTQKLPTKTQQFTAYNAQPWICQLLFGHHLRYGKPVIPWSSIFSVARQQASLSYFIKVSRPSPGAKVAIRYCLFRFSPLMFPNPKELHMLNVNDVFFLEKWKNIWISQELHIHHCGFDWILRGIVYLGSFFLKMPCLLWTKSRKGQAMTLVKHGWIRQMFIWVATLSAHVPGLLRTAFQRLSRLTFLKPWKASICFWVWKCINESLRRLGGWSQVMQQRSLRTNLKRTSESLKF